MDDCARDELTGRVIGAAIEVHRQLGPGLLESMYRGALASELSSRDIPVEEEVAIPVSYKGLPLPGAFRVDLVVDRDVMVELKHVETVLPVHRAQALTYMHLGGFAAGLLLNFNEARLVDGITRFYPDAPPR